MTVIEPRWQGAGVTLYLDDCLNVMRQMPDASVDAVVTDPPGAISFMGKSWDGDRGGRDRWITWLAERMAEALRVLKPGGHALVWALPRTSGWTQIALEDAGFEVRDCIVHLFGQGYPKSLDISKAIDAASGAEREVIGEGARFGRGAMRNRSRVSAGYRPSEVNPDGGVAVVTAPATTEAGQWDGWGTALKPGQEIWWLARRPFKGTVVANVLKHGTGVLNVDECRVGDGGQLQWARPRDMGYHGGTDNGQAAATRNPAGRWPPNLVLTHSATCEVTGTRLVQGDSRSGHAQGRRPGGFAGTGADSGSTRPNGALHGDQVTEVLACAPDCPVAELDRQSGVLTSGDAPRTRGSGKFRDAYGEFAGQRDCPPGHAANSGGASRFYPVFRYAAKAPASERPRLEDGTAHPTVKPASLLAFLCRLITPPGGTVLDLFAGSGTTATACIVEGFRCVLMSRPVQPSLLGLVTE